METITYTLPAYWASAIINGDFSGLDVREALRCKAELKAIADEGFTIVSCDDEPRFTWSYRLYDPAADCDGGEVLDFTAIAR